MNIFLLILDVIVIVDVIDVIVIVIVIDKDSSR